MKSILALVAFFSASLSASPIKFTPPSVTVSVINGITGYSAQATVPADGTVFTVPDLFQNSDIDERGQILATSAQLIQFVEGVFCSFNRDTTVVPLNPTTTFTILNAEDVTSPALLNDVTFQCQV